MRKFETKEDTLAAIELVVKEFLNADSVGKWWSVKERSLSNLVKQVGLDVRYCTSIYDELKNLGMIERMGEKAQMRYKIVTNLIPDSRGVAEKIWRNNNDRRNQCKVKWLETRRGDLTPPKKGAGTSFEDFERKQYNKDKKKAVKLNEKNLQRIPRLGEIAYAIVNGFITEAKIICVRFDDNDKVLVDFTTPIKFKDGDEEQYVVRRDCCLKSISFSLDEIIQKLQNSVKRFEK